ncbi:protein PHYTOCHROME-DEPENDENT LATE-FLOWERING-like [Phoenix dactylifera]|uniref:Protein PHYTOCHROME-DEPENDENT LATE-FLOWERING-like n=1 Tax=Phoenix dactylifera TaxID=42345 RepID=A0A8B8IZY8_PHODC|nr:protein PHYTOCHROME-DEPENDENT LATE-FLOWERING-like [Phoenix dactylifera]
MGVSFKVSKVGTRYRPKLPPPDSPAGAGEKDADPDTSGDAPDPKLTDREVALPGLGDGFAGSVLSANSESNLVGPDHEVSFSLNLFPDGFSVGRPTEGMLLPLLEDAPKLLHPYDRASKTLFSAIEYGWLPSDILDDLPCKYFNGTLICEVRDYRSCMSKFRNSDSSGDEFPRVQKVCLRMGMENVVKDMPSISDDSWTYNDLLQAESQIVKALQPMLYLGPDPSLDRLCRTVPKQVDLGIYKQKLMSKQHDMLEVNHKSTNLDMSSNGYAESLKSQTSFSFKNDSAHHSQCAISRSMPHVQQVDSMKDVTVPSLPLAFQPNYNLVVSCPLSVSSNVVFASAPDQNLRDSWLGLKNPINLLGKRTRSKIQPTSKTNGKRPKQEPPDLVSSQIITSQRDTLLEQEPQRNTTLAQKHQEAQNMQHLRFHDQNSSQQQRSEASIERTGNLEAEMPSYLYQEHVQHIVKEEPGETEILCRIEVEKDREGHAQDIRSEISSEQQTPSCVRALPLQMQEIGAGQSVEKYPKKERASRKRKPSQGPQGSARGSDSHVSKLGDRQRILSSCSTSPNVTVVGLSKDKVASVPAASIGTLSANSASSSSLIQESQLTLPKRKKSKALNKVTSQSMSEIGSLAHVGESNVSFGSNSSSVGIGLLPPSGTDVDPSALERFSKIEVVSQRHGLNSKRNKIEEFPTTKSLSECSLPPARLVMREDTEECGPLTENLCMSKYLIGGSRNAHKTRKITFVRVRFFFRGNGIPFLVDESRCKLILTESEELDMHEVRAEVVFGDKEQHFHTALLHNPHHADLFAAQFASLMEREGYKVVDDQLQPLLSCTRGLSIDSVHTDSRGVTLYPCTTPVTSQSLKPISPFGDSISALNLCQFPPQNIQMPSRAPTSSLNLTRQQQLDIVSHLNSVQQQHPQFQSPLPFVWNNPLVNTNMHVGNATPNSIAHPNTNMQVGNATPNSIPHPNTNMQMGNATPNSIPHLNLLRLQQSKWQNYEQQAILQNKMTILGATNNIVGMGECESGLNVCRNNDHLIQVPGLSHSGTQFLQRGTSETSAAVLAKLRQAGSQGMGVVSGSMPAGSSTYGIFGMTGDGSLLDQILGRSCTDQFQYRDTQPTIFPNKQSLNLSTNNYDQQRQQNMHPRGNLQLPLQQLQQQLACQHDLLTVNQSIRQLQQHQLGSPQQHESQISLMSPKQLSSGSASQQVNTGIANAGSPQVSSQTGASGGSVVNSPMLQGPQKGNYHGKSFMRGQ